ncbi:BON domain-containing protein [Paraburkholderia acidisoli]|uniref:BON domain-containing protein n=1 Tax=Paraburkholderia acidisoli TaxID=2571748 RepID=A0A7Z2GJS3_9BURK|nr:BON domain-containing protein [Paraburkholderia acidisoli]QGZ63061.1 BON domain-containing protein [Paraburkholderia acidisoli]
MSLSKYLSTFALALAALSLAGTAFAQDDAAAAPAAPLTKKQIRTQNHQLESKVRHTLNRTKELDASGITIVARNGKITLDGTAEDDTQIQLAATTAATVPGVTGVSNYVRMREPGH